MCGDTVEIQEMEKHPFFMTKVPEAGEPMSPLMEGLQQLKYSETDNTPQGTVCKRLELCAGRHSLLFLLITYSYLQGFGSLDPFQGYTNCSDLLIYGPSSD
jgi:hypothetical protein